MSGWQRIGVVISVLWLVGLPVYLQFDANRRIYNHVLDCTTARGLVAASAGATLAQIRQLCLGVYGPSVSYGDLARTFRDDVVMLGLLLVPIVLFWIVGWIVLGTVRWVRRGFTGPGR